MVSSSVVFRLVWADEPELFPPGNDGVVMAGNKNKAKEKTREK